MDITQITNTNELPKQFRYAWYWGSQNACEQEHARKYPHYQGITAYYYPARQYLYVPMEWNREAADAKTD